MALELRRYIGKRVNVLFDDRMNRLDAGSKEDIENHLIYGGEDRETTWITGQITSANEDGIHLKNSTYEGADRPRSMWLSSDDLVAVEGQQYDPKKKPKVPDNLRKKGRYRKFIGKRVRILVDRKLDESAGIFDSEESSFVEGVVVGGDEYMQLILARYSGEPASKERDMDINKGRISSTEGEPYNNGPDSENGT